MSAFAKAASSGFAVIQRSARRHRGSAAALLGAGALAAAWCGGQAALADATGDGDAAGELPVGKLACHRNVAAPRTPAVLVSCGSFNPPTVMHLRMFDLAVAALAERGFDVWGCYLSPVGDAYGKPGLAPAAQRLAMCRLAAAGTDNVMVDAWEAAQPGYTRTLQVLRRVRERLESYLQSPPSQHQQQSDADAVHAAGLTSAAAAAGEAPAASSSSSSTHASKPGDGAAAGAAAAAGSAPAPRVMLLCGADLLATIAQPGVWHDPRAVLRDHGIVAIARAGTDLTQLLQQPGSLLHEFRDSIIVVEEPVGNGVSSTKVRQLLAAGQPVRYLVPDAVIAYVKAQGLYGAQKT